MIFECEPEQPTDGNTKSKHERKENESMKGHKFRALRTPGAGWILPLAAAGWLAAIRASAQSDTHTNAWAGNRALMMQGMMRNAITQSNMVERYHAMIAAHEKMQAAMRQQDAELDKLVAELKQARGKKREDLMADILTKMVQDRTTLHQQMAALHLNMMRLMMNQTLMNMKSGEAGQPMSSTLKPSINRMGIGMMGGGMMGNNMMGGGGTASTNQ